MTPNALTISWEVVLTKAGWLSDLIATGSPKFGKISSRLFFATQMAILFLVRKASTLQENALSLPISICTLFLWTQFYKVDPPKCLWFLYSHIYLTWHFPLPHHFSTHRYLTSSFSTSFPTLVFLYCPLKSSVIFLLSKWVHLCTWWTRILLISEKTILPSFSHT